MERTRVSLGKLITPALFRYHVHQHRLICRKCGLKRPGHKLDIVTVNWTHIGDSHVLEKHSRHNKMLNGILGTL